MKTILTLVATLFVSAQTFAMTTEYKWPVINGLAINNMCATSKTFKSLRPIKVCVETGVLSRTACRQGGEAEICRNLRPNEAPRIDETVTESTKCVKFQSKAFEVSRESKVMKCVKWSSSADGECRKYETFTTLTGKVFNVETYRNSGSAELGSEFIGYTKFEVPNCK